MPQLYNAAVITDAGIALLNRAQAGEVSIQFTRMAAGDGVYTEEEKTLSALQGSTGLKSERGSYPISSVGAASDNSVKLTAIITNQDPVTGETLVSDGYYINEMGLYAKEKDGDDSAEVLYSIVTVASGNGDYMPPYNGHSPAQIVQEYHATVSNAAEVTIRCTGAALLVEDAERRFSAIEEDIDARFSSFPPISDLFEKGTIPTRDADGNTYLGRIFSNTTPDLLSLSSDCKISDLYFVISHDKRVRDENNEWVYVPAGFKKISIDNIKNALLDLEGIRSIDTNCMSDALKYRCICDVMVSGNVDSMHFFDVYRTSGNITRFIIVSTLKEYTGDWSYTKEIRFYKVKIFEADATDEISVYMTTDAKYDTYVRCYFEDKVGIWTKNKIKVIMYSNNAVIEYGSSDRPSLSSLPEGYISPGETVII